MERELAFRICARHGGSRFSCRPPHGTGDKEAADQAAVDAMRRVFDTIHIAGTVVIGEGEMDEAPMLYIGEKVGTGDEPEVDVAVDPLEGTNLVAKGLPNALSVVAVAPKGCLLHAPDIYMDKIAVGPKAKGCIHLDAPVEENLKNVAAALGKNVEDVTAIILDRLRHGNHQANPPTGARVKLISDGDVSAAMPRPWKIQALIFFLVSAVHLKASLAAAALKCLGERCRDV